MKQILEQFLVRIDENGKEVEKPKEDDFNEWEEWNDSNDKWENATEVIKLPTLSEFWKTLWDKYSTVTEYESVYFNDYVNFLQQPLTKEMFIGEDAIFYNNKGCETIAVYNLYSTIGEALNDKVTLYLNPDKI